MTVEARAYAVAAYRAQLLDECLRVPASLQQTKLMSNELYALCRPFYEQAYQDAHISWNTVDATLLQKILSEQYADSRLVQAALKNQASADCKSLYAQWLDCGDAPGISANGPWHHLREDGSTCCPTCLTNDIYHCEFSKTSRYKGVVDESLTSVNLFLPVKLFNIEEYDTSLVRIKSSYEAGYRFYWQGYDRKGRYWTGNLGLPGHAPTDMWNSKRFDDESHLRK